MKYIKHAALGVLLSLGAFSATVYTSCSKDACKSTTCINNGSCSGGMCICPTGIGGANCETVYRKVFANSYMGNATYNINGVDSSYIIRTEAANQLNFMASNDTAYTEMQLEWKRTIGANRTMRIVLSNATAAGASFTVTPFTADTFTYTGAGSVSGTMASLNLVESHPNSPAIIISLHNFTRE